MTQVGGCGEPDLSGAQRDAMIMAGHPVQNYRCVRVVCTDTLCQPYGNSIHRDGRVLLLEFNFASHDTVEGPRRRYWSDLMAVSCQRAMAVSGGTLKRLDAIWRLNIVNSVSKMSCPTSVYAVSYVLTGRIRILQTSSSASPEISAVPSRSLQTVTSFLCCSPQFTARALCACSLTGRKCLIGSSLEERLSFIAGGRPLPAFVGSWRRPVLQPFLGLFLRYQRGRSRERSAGGTNAFQRLLPEALSSQHRGHRALHRQCLRQSRKKP